MGPRVAGRKCQYPARPQLRNAAGPYIWVSPRKARDEPKFSRMPSIAAGSEPLRHLRSAPRTDILGRLRTLIETVRRHAAANHLLRGAPPGQAATKSKSEPDFGTETHFSRLALDCPKIGS